MVTEKIAGIICEYNPFHNGHAYQIEEIRRRGYGTVVAVMSGNTVQRGEFAIADKYARARAALCGGADLVLELPYPYSASSTEFFAAAGIRILDAIGAHAVCFGSESAELEKLTAAARICASSEFEEKYREMSRSALGTAAAYFAAYKELTGEEMPSGSNDILGIAYLKATISEGAELKAEVVKRKGSGYRETDLSLSEEKINPSAMMIRKEIANSGITERLCGLMPEEVLRIINESNISNPSEHLERTVLGFFRLASPMALSADRISEAGGGLAEKLCKVSHKAQTLAEFKELAMGGKYTLSRVNRAMLHCMIGATEDDVRNPPAYSTVLGFNSKGKKLLSTLRKSSRIPIVTKPADAPEISESTARQSELSYKADALYSLCFDKIGRSSDYITRMPERLS